MREWIGPRVAQNLSEHEYTLSNKSYESTVEVDRDHIEDDNLGIYSSIMMPQLGEAARKHPQRLLVSALQGSPLAFDGLSLFNDAHLTYNATTTTYDNNFALALTGDNFNTVWSTMCAYVGEDGEPLGVMPNLLIVPPQLKKAALDIMSASLTVGTNVAGGTNSLQGWCEVLVCPELANQATTWYLADTSKAIKPFIFQMRRPVEFVARDNAADPKVFEQKKFTYGCEGRYNIGVSLPFLIAKSVG
jgi:phage major head subunit gpT-like protein